MPQFGTLAITADMPTTGSGTVINSGTGSQTGDTGDFYLDTAKKILYGPKVAAGSGTNEYAVNQATVPAIATSGPNDITWGLKVRFASSGSVKALRYYRSASATVPSRTLRLYRAGVVVATVTSPGESGSGWKNIPLGTPVDVDTTADYVVAYYAASDYYVESAGKAPAGSTNITILSGCYAWGNTFPSTDVSNNYFADLALETLWPIALTSA